MKFFSRIAFICNVSFILFIVLGYIELNNKKNKNDDNLIPLPFITGLLVILGQFAIFINLLFCLIILVRMMLKKPSPHPQWLVIANFIFLLVQVFYFFIY